MVLLTLTLRVKVKQMKGYEGVPHALIPGQGELQISEGVGVQKVGTLSTS